MNQPIISVFGSSAPQAGSAVYEVAYRVGQLLAEAGFAVATGGYGGTMTAVSHGASEAGGHVIGVTSAQIEQFRPEGANRYVREEIRYETLRDRLLHLITHNAGMITLPGGIGTLSEMTLAWSFLQVGEISPRPLVLLGEMWPTTVQAAMTGGYIRPANHALLTFVDTPETAVAALGTQRA
ncbi:MAG: LOG family protein [Ardenticatenaceae bacterium]|nr:LOG family protein [Ardenticatenaceae bacterium]